MLTQARFRSAVVLSMALALAGATASCLGESTLPAPLREHLAQQGQADWTGKDWLLLVIALPMLAATLASFSGMLKFQSWSRPLSIALWPISLVLLPLFGPTVEPALATGLSALSSVLSGALIAASYLPPAVAWFEASDAPPHSKDSS